MRNLHGTQRVLRTGARTQEDKRARLGGVRSRRCPACRAWGRRPLYHQRFDNSHGAAPFGGYDVVACDGCGTCFADRIPSQRSLDSYYSRLSKYENRGSVGKPSDVRLPAFNHLASVVNRFVPDRSARILEIGCATGALLAEIRDLGFPAVRGLDPSRYCCRAARRLYGLRVDFGSLFDREWKAWRPDLVILAGVLEHVRDLGTCLAWLQAGLAPKGRVMVAVPDAEGFAQNIGAPFQEFSMEHIAYFTKASLSGTMRRSGFTPLFLERISLPETEGTDAPLVVGVFEKRLRLPRRPRPDRSGERALRAYIRASMDWENRLQARIESLIASEEPLIVWGVGTHTLRLLKSGRLGEAPIEAFVDSNPKYHGRRLGGVVVYDPSFIRRSRLPIVISSQVFQREIVRQIRDELRCPNPIITLYDD